MIHAGPTAEPAYRCFNSKMLVAFKIFRNRQAIAASVWREEIHPERMNDAFVMARRFRAADRN